MCTATAEGAVLLWCLCAMPVLSRSCWSLQLSSGPAGSLKTAGWLSAVSWLSGCPGCQLSADPVPCSALSTSSHCDLCGRLLCLCHSSRVAQCSTLCQNRPDQSSSSHQKLSTIRRSTSSSWPLLHTMPSLWPLVDQTMPAALLPSSSSTCSATSSPLPECTTRSTYWSPS